MSFVLTRTPYRVSFIGGGSDLPAFYENDGPGVVIGATINKYMHVSVNTRHDQRYRVSYSRTEEASLLEEIEHDLARESIRYVGTNLPIEVHSTGDLPSGTGLGSSSAYTVGLIHALRIWRNQPAHRAQLAEIASIVEIDRCHHPIGKQDQYLCTYGGCNQFTFRKGGAVDVAEVIPDTPIDVSAHRSILLLRVGDRRHAGNILAQQSRRLAYNVAYRRQMRAIVDMVASFRVAFEATDYKACGHILHEAWELKKGLADGITNDRIDYAYLQALEAGAYGGKLCGAGGAGYLMLFVPQNRAADIIDATKLNPLDYRFESLGSQVVYYH